jgi:hypothetical protein
MQWLSTTSRCITRFAEKAIRFYCFMAGAVWAPEGYRLVIQGLRGHGLIFGELSGGGETDIRFAETALKFLRGF